MKVVTAGTCMLLYAFAVVRAIRVPLTFDEAAAFLRYIDTDFPSVFHTSLFSIFNFEVATNHFLNTLLTKVCYLVAGSSELALRTPNLIGYAMYLWFAQLLLRRCSDRAIAVAGFLLLNLNPYLLDFFTASRGYGLSLGFLLGALYFLFRLVDALRDGASPVISLRRTLALACAAVMANFALLNAYVGIFAIALVGLLAVRSPAASTPSGDVDRSAVGSRIPHPGSRIPHPGSRVPGPRVGHTATERLALTSRARRRLLWLPVVAVTFIALVLSQDLGLSGSLYEGVSVSVAGLDPTELDTVVISRIDIRGREARLSRDPGTPIWRLSVPVPVQALRMELSERVVASLTTIETVVGNREILYDARRPGAWKSRVAGNTHVFESTPLLSLRRSRLDSFAPIINWAGDRTYAVALVRKTAIVMAVLALLAVILSGLGSFGARKNLLPIEHWRSLASGMLWLAALAGTPLFLLRRDSQLYFGGTHGLIADTFYSIVENSFYGRKYHPAQINLVFAAVLATVVGFTIVAAISYRRRTVSAVLPAAVLLALLALISGGLVAQHLLFRTVYLVGRTALFYIPLYVLLLTFVCDGGARFGPAAGGVARAALFAVASLSALHFMTTANARFTFDWQEDASTKMMMADLAEVIGAERPPRTHATLGVAWIYAPVSIYYAHRHRDALIEVAVGNSAGSAEFFYGGERSGGAGMTTVRRYPFTHTALMTPRVD